MVTKVVFLIANVLSWELSEMYIGQDSNKNFYNTKHNHGCKFLRHNVHSSIIFSTDSLVKLICKRRINDSHLYLGWNLSGVKYSLHKIMNYWNNKFNRQRFHYTCTWLECTGRKLKSRKRNVKTKLWNTKVNTEYFYAL